jgi:hypothetical protein
MQTEGRGGPMKRPKVKPLSAQDLFAAGIPIPVSAAAEFSPNADELIRIEYIKSITRALKRDKGFKVCVADEGVIAFQRLCDWCDEPRGEMWIVDPDVWNQVIPYKKRQDDICLKCWESVAQ